MITNVNSGVGLLRVYNLANQLYNLAQIMSYVYASVLSSVGIIIVPNNSKRFCKDCMSSEM